MGFLALRRRERVANSDNLQPTPTYCNEREGYYRMVVQRKPTLAKYLRGWLNRLNALRHELGLAGFKEPQLFDFGEAAHVAKLPVCSARPYLRLLTAATPQSLFPGFI